MAANSLPPELLDEILGNIQGKKDLCNASLISPVWTDPSQRYLLARVSVAAQGGAQEFEEFRLFIHKNLHIRCHIRHLQLRGAPSTKPQVNADLISVLLCDLYQLETLHLRQVRFGPAGGRYLY